MGSSDHDHLVENPYHNIHPWKRLKREVMGFDRRDLWVTVIYSIAIGLVSLVLPVATQALVNTVAFGVVLQPLLYLSILVFMALLFNTGLNGLRFYVVEMIQRRIFVRTASNVVHRLLRVRNDAFDEHHGPELVNRFLEVVTVQKAAASLLVDGLSVMFQTLIGMTLLAVYHPWLLAFDVLLLLAILVVVFPLGTGAISTSIRESKAKYNLLAWMQEIARHQILFKTDRGADYAVSKSDYHVRAYLEYRGKHFRTLLRQVIGSFTIQALSSAALLSVGGWLVIQGQLTLGQLIAAELMVVLVVTGFTKFGKHLESFYDLMAATDKLGYLMDLPLERENGDALNNRERGAAVKLDNVTLGYGASNHTLEHANWEIPADSRIGLIGSTGSGKSTLLDALYGRRDPSEGHLEIDGWDYRDIRPGSLRGQVALVRTAEIFEGSLLDNLKLGDPDIDAGRAREVLERVGLLDAVNSLPEGVRTMLSTGGRPLSPGQQVQLEIARALACRPRFLIMDEALDHLDDLPNRETLLDCLFAPGAGWTLLVVSESPEILARCEKVYMLRHGAITLFRSETSRLNPEVMK